MQQLSILDQLLGPAFSDFVNPELIIVVFVITVLSIIVAALR